MKSQEELRKIQRQIAKKVILKDMFSKPITTIAGFDLAFSNERAFAAGVLLNYKTLDIRETKIIKTDLSFPYIPTFLTFREGPPIIQVYKKLQTKPDIIMINGQGISHPLFCGIASHVGVLLDIPSIGIAQSKLCGEYKEPKEVGDCSPIFYERRKVGYVYKSKRNCKPIFISPGHKVSFETSLKIVKSCMKDRKLPEPISLAHSFAERTKISTQNK